MGSGVSTHVQLGLEDVKNRLCSGEDHTHESESLHSGRLGKVDELRKECKVGNENTSTSSLASTQHTYIAHDNRENTLGESSEKFMDSVLIRGWLTKEESLTLFEHLKDVGEKHNHPRTDKRKPSFVRYPLWSLYYGFRRKKDGARALDRWGSYHESWCRVMEPTDILAKYCAKLRRDFHLSDESVNSVVVNYYYDGDTTYIPAHRDTTACLEEGTHVHCLSLGAARDFLLTSNEDTGKFEKENMTIEREWRVRDGDLFSLGDNTNAAFLHAVPREKALSKMRISVIFRSVDKSFINLEGERRHVEYASGNIHTFSAECIRCCLWLVDAHFIVTTCSSTLKYLFY